MTTFTHVGALFLLFFEVIAGAHGECVYAGKQRHAPHDSWKHFLDLAYWNVELGEDVES